MKFVINTNVIISATLWDNSEAQKLLFKLLGQRDDIYSSVDILNEYSRILARDFDYGKYEIELIVKKILGFMILVEPTKRITLIEKDPDDNKILECAIAAKAHFIVTYDKHLLDLIKFRNVRIITPNQVLRLY